jgi:hypothetical protein
VSSTSTASSRERDECPHALLVQHDPHRPPAGRDDIDHLAELPVEHGDVVRVGVRHEPFERGDRRWRHQDREHRPETEPVLDRFRVVEREQEDLRFLLPYLEGGLKYRRLVRHEQGGFSLGGPEGSLFNGHLEPGISAGLEAAGRGIPLTPHIVRLDRSEAERAGELRPVPADRGNTVQNEPKPLRLPGKGLKIQIDLPLFGERLPLHGGSEDAPR